MPPFDALLVVSFGGPEGPDDVMPFLRRVTAGRGVPDDRLAVVAEHYRHFGGVSPINGQNRELIAAIESEFAGRGWTLPIYWGNRNWHPLLADPVRAMRDDGVERALAFVTSAFGSYSGCRQYREDIERARQEVGPGAPVIEKLRLYGDQPGFLDSVQANVADALDQLPGRTRDQARLVFTAHSIPLSMADVSPYEVQLREAAATVTSRLAGSYQWDLVWQSRSGPPSVPWLEPDIVDHLRTLAGSGVTDVVVVPIGFVSDHVEVQWDLDTEARAVADETGLRLVRAATVGTAAPFVTMIADLVAEAVALGQAPGVCAPGCCLATTS